MNIASLCLPIIIIIKMCFHLLWPQCVSSVNSIWSSKQARTVNLIRKAEHVRLSARRSPQITCFAPFLSPRLRETPAVYPNRSRFWPLWYNQSFNHPRQSNEKRQTSSRCWKEGGSHSRLFLTRLRDRSALWCRWEPAAAGGGAA